MPVFNIYYKLTKNTIMKNIIKSTAYSAVALSSVAFTSAIDYWVESWKKFAGTTWEWDLKWTLESILEYILTFLAFIAVAFAIYGGFQILTAGWDEDKVKKGKTTLINALIWVFVIMISWTLVSWIFTSANTAVSTSA